MQSFTGSVFRIELGDHAGKWRGRINISCLVAEQAVFDTREEAWGWIIRKFEERAGK